MEENRCEPRRNLDIFVKRILARHCQKNEQIVFDVAGNQKTPLRLYICNEKAGCEELPVRCISDIKFLLCDTDQQIICNHKSKITVDFKLLLIVKYTNCNFQCITLPDDAFRPSLGNEVRVCIDSIPSNQGQFPALIGEIGNQRLEIVKEGSGPNANYFFRFTKNVPLKDFDAEIPQSAFDDPSLMSHILVKNVKFEVDVDGECPGTGPNKCCNCVGDTNATIVDIKVFADIIDKIGIDQDIWVNGEADDHC
jgi:hypothetical protein